MTLNNKHTHFDVGDSSKQTRHVMIEKIKVVKTYYLDSTLPEEEHVVYQNCTISHRTWNELKSFEAPFCYIDA